MILIALLILFLYILIMIIKTKNVPISISETYYILRNKFWFGISLIIPTLLTMPKMLEVSGDFGIFALLTCIGIILVGMSPNFKNKYEYKAHFWGAVIALFSSQIWVGIFNPWLLLIWIIPIGILAFIKKQRINYLFWIEVYCILITFLTLISIY